jgi:hypothetical protein
MTFRFVLQNKNALLLTVLEIERTIYIDPEPTVKENESGHSHQPSELQNGRVSLVPKA